MASARTDTIAHDDLDRELITGEAVALDLRAAGFVVRAAGAAIDFLVYFGGYLLLSLLFTVLTAGLGLDSAITAAIGVVGLVLCLVVAPVTVETVNQGKSLGRLALGTRIVRDDGGSIGFRHAFIRAITGIFEVFMTFGGMAAIIALLNGRSKRLGDLVAGTYSQNERIPHETPPVYGVPVELTEWATTADVARMPDRLSRRISTFLGQAGKLTGASRDRLSRELANEAAVYVSPLPRANAELFLAAVVALRRERERTALELEQAGLDRLAPVLEGMPRGFPERG